MSYFIYYIKTISLYIPEMGANTQAVNVRPFNKINPIMSCVLRINASRDSMKLVYLLISGWFSLTLSKWYVNLKGSTVIAICIWSTKTITEGIQESKLGVQIVRCIFDVTCLKLNQEQWRRCLYCLYIFGSSGMISMKIRYHSIHCIFLWAWALSTFSRVELFF